MRWIDIRVCGGTCSVRMGLFACACTLAAGCSSPRTQPSRPFDGAGAAEAYVADRTPEQGDTIRVHSVQRLASGNGDALTATVSVRNVGTTARRVTVVVAWLARDRRPVESGPETRETITINPQETRQLTFAGAPEARDFKVSLSYPDP